MKGWKTKLGAVIMAVSGIVGPLNTVLVPLGHGIPDPEAVTKLLLTIGSALATVGIGHKLDKATQ